MYRKTKRKKLLAKPLLMLLVLLVASAALLYFKVSRHGSSITSPSNDSSVESSGPTDEERNSGDEKKLELIEDTGSESDDPLDDKKKANVIITDAGQYGSVIEVRAFINNHFQDGTCLIEFKKDDHRVTKTAPAYTDSSTTICTVPEIKRSEFSSIGEWQVTVTYKSTDAQGSMTQSITIK